MTNINDPNPYDRSRTDRMARGGMGGGALIATVVAVILLIGALMYAMSGRTTSTADIPQTSPTTGQSQGGARVIPGPNQNAPNPTPPESK